MRRVVGVIVLTSLLVGVLVPVRPWLEVAASARTPTDILDVQRIVSGILESATPDAATDVNGDGEINILDFHAALTGIVQVEPAETPEKGRPEGKQAVLIQVLRLFERAPARPSIVPPRSESRKPVAWSRCSDIFSLALLKERCLVSLPPHAPPANSPEQYA